ncbi:MAG: CinA family nicotinamide mononucleotide deamidase-related protein [Deltaproteobacteria bacterium]|nr:CinA family nicotinamide mononucleotide deamidase-related protein [Deltaproteobacteria bacterium]MBT6433544.1 CinA family nicotinamide mononucleotide deamidase-related protein [Deltaproteobacteria bacterium]MBT6491571.1 CinA family nicotinamide mononucleotide deamidase-related protein [Deltaproteobacteria bacterium]
MTRIEALIIGDELLDGRVTDTNTVRLAQKLGEMGLKIQQRTTITDDLDIIICEAKRIAERETKVCVVSGGLGPTSDDITAESFARLLGVELERDAAQAQKITDRLIGRGREVTANQLKQADRPLGAEVIENHHGTAPGFAVVYQGCRFVSVPGVPREFDPMIESAVLAPLQETSAEPARVVLRTFGMVEAQVETKIKELSTKWPMVRLGFRAHFPTIDVSLSSDADDRPALEEAAGYAREKLGNHLFSEEKGPFAASLVKMLQEAQATVATAESCTGGKVGDLITDVSGSSAVFREGVVAYCNEVKVSRLAVKPETLEAHGAVSEPVVLEMARGVREKAGATYGLAISGIAGPSGGTPEKPVGTVFLAAVGEHFEEVRKLSLVYGRERNKVVSAFGVLDLLRRALQRRADS